MTIPQAFEQDNFTVTAQHTINGSTGYFAEHKTAINVVAGKKKFALYVEGTPYDMGYLTGYLAADSVETMATVFLDNIAPCFIFGDAFVKKWFGGCLMKQLERALVDFVYEFTREMYKDVPAAFKQELLGIEDGLKAAKPGSKVTAEDLWALNAGFDCLLSVVYAPDEFLRRFPKFKPEYFQIPLYCNAFSVFNNALASGDRGNRHYFGRDFMFADGLVFQDEACMIVYNPGDDRSPIVSVTAPGIIGSMTAMNTTGIAAGVDMAPAGNCNHHRAGYNSLFLVRGAIHEADSAQTALDYMVEAQRGVSWIYVIADGANDRSVVVEAGMKQDDLDAVGYPPQDLWKLGILPGHDFLVKHENQKPEQGLMARWNDYTYPEAFLSWNDDLFAAYGKVFEPADFGEQGYICKRVDGVIQQNCPDSFYFAPQRENRNDVLIATNHFIVPTMRLCGMSNWTTLVSQSHYADIQWRYDKLNDLILSNYGDIDADKAWWLINFIAPDPGSAVPDYYAGAEDVPYTDPSGQTKYTKAIGGAISLCELKGKTIKSRYGYYADEPVEITLMHYIS